MPLKDFLLPAFFQVVFDKLATGLIFLFVHWDRIHVVLKNWGGWLSSIQAQTEDAAGETQGLRSAVDLACEVTDPLDEMAMFPGSEDPKETTREILAYEYLPSIASTYGTQGEEDNIQLARMHREKSRKWKKKYRPRKLYQWKSIKWKKKHPLKHTKDVRTRNKSVGDITGPSTSTKDNHDHLVYSLVDTLASRSAAWILQSMTEYCRELYEEKAPAQTHDHIHKEQSSPLRNGEGLKTPAELNIEPRTSATLDSTLEKITEQLTCMDRRFVEQEKKVQQVLNCVEKQDVEPRTYATLDSTLEKITEQLTCMDRKFVEQEKKVQQVLNCVEKQDVEPRTYATLDSTLEKITEQLTCMDRRFVEQEKKVQQVLNCVAKRDASPICAQDRKRQHARKFRPAKRQKTRGPEVANYPYTLPVYSVPSSPVVDATSNTPTQDSKTRRAHKLPPAKRQKTRGPAVAKYPNTQPMCNVPSSPVVQKQHSYPVL